MITRTGLGLGIQGQKKGKKMKIEIKNSHLAITATASVVALCVVRLIYFTIASQGLDGLAEEARIQSGLKSYSIGAASIDRNCEISAASFFKVHKWRLCDIVTGKECYLESVRLRGQMDSCVTEILRKKADRND